MKNKLLVIITTISLIACNNNKQYTNTTSNYTIPDTIQIVTGNGKVIPRSGILDIASQTAGIVTHIYTKAGDKVNKGDTIAILQDTKARLNVEQVSTKLTSQASNIAIARKEVEQNRLSMNRAENDYKTDLKLYRIGAETRENLAKSKDEFEKNKIIYTQSIEKLHIAQQQIATLKDERKIAQTDYQNCIIRAPQKGRILDVLVDNGTTVKAFDNIATFAANEPIIVEAEIDEQFATKLKIGQNVDITPIGYTQIIGHGKIVDMMDFLSNKSIFSGLNTEKQDRQMRRIKIALDKDSQSLLIGMKVSCNVHIR